MVIKPTQDHILCYLKFVAEVTSASLEESGTGCKLLRFCFLHVCLKGLKLEIRENSDKIFLITQKLFSLS